MLIGKGQLMTSTNNEQTENYFDKVAGTWDTNPVRVELAKKVGQAIAEKIPLHEKMLMMDFGCGSGLISLQLASKVSFITAADRSTGMLHVLAANMSNAGIHNVKAQDLKSDMNFNSQEKYNLITANMVLHHVKDIDKQLQEFHGWNNKQGWLALSDLEPEDGTFHKSEAGTVHFGIDPQLIAGKLEKLGYVVHPVSRVYEVEKKEKMYPVFLLVAQKQ